MTITTDELVERNASFAATGVHEKLQFPSGRELRVLSCVDSRVDPSDVLGLELGDAVVMRNIGGRVTPAALRAWQLLGRLSPVGADGRPLGGPLHMVLLQHTDCGIKRLGKTSPELLAESFEVPVDELAGQHIHDPYAALELDAETIRNGISRPILVTGLVYDVATGLVEVVVRPES